MNVKRPHDEGLSRFITYRANISTYSKVSLLSYASMYVGTASEQLRQ